MSLGCVFRRIAACLKLFSSLFCSLYYFSLFIEYFVALVEVEIFRRKQVNVVHVISHDQKMYSKTSLSVILK